VCVCVHICAVCYARIVDKVCSATYIGSTVVPACRDREYSSTRM
jgi:hypothetical protein